MQIFGINNYTYTPSCTPTAFKGHSRQLEKVLDKVVNKNQISENEKNLIIEKIKGSKVDPELENKIHIVGFILLMILMLYITVQDIIRLF